MEQVNKRIVTLDIAKLIMMMFVITIHYGFFGLNESFKATLPRVGVPFFLIVTGYFLYSSDIKLQNRKYIRALIKSLLMSIFAFSLYFIYEMLITSPVEVINSFKNIKDLKRFLIFHDHSLNSHLWYIFSYPTALSITYLLLRLVKNNKVLISIASGLLLLNLLIGNYSIFLGIKTELCHSRNAYLCSTPFMLVGALIKKNNKLFIKKYTYQYLLFGLILFILQFFEFKFFCIFRPLEKTDLFITTIVSVIFLFIGLINIDIKYNSFYKIYDKNIPFLMYILQRIVNNLSWKINQLHIILNSRFHSLYIFIVLYVVAFILCKLLNLLISLIKGGFKREKRFIGNNFIN